MSDTAKEEPPEPAIPDESKPDPFFDDPLPVKKILLVATGLVLAYFAACFADVWWTSGQVYEGDATAAVVLGAAQYNGAPSGALKGRLDTAADLYLDDRVEFVVVTGGGQEDETTTEAKAGYDYLRVAGVPDEHLRLEVQGTSTYESIAAAARFLREEEVTDVILVSDPYHARRAILIADEVGLRAGVVSTGSSVSVSRLVDEALAVGIGRVTSFRRLDNWVRQRTS